MITLLLLVAEEHDCYGKEAGKSELVFAYLLTDLPQNEKLL